MSGKWTPGPWSLDRNEEEGGIAILNASGAQLAIVHGEGEQGSDEARLIAASPELAEALEELLDYSGGAEHALADEYVVDRARAALAKAKGEGA